MSVDFHLFDVNHGQCAALRLSNGRWCIFDVGSSSDFSPVNWIVKKESASEGATLLSSMFLEASFRFLKATISHLHGDHITDHRHLFQHGPDFMKTVAFDQAYLEHCKQTSSPDSWIEVQAFASHFSGNYSGIHYPDYAGVNIQELSLDIAVARGLGGSANTQVNNASIITRIDVHGNTILLCGDMESNAWEAIINDQGLLGATWRPFLSNIDILVAPHHGHSSAYSPHLLRLANPAIALLSVVSKDPHVDNRYSSEAVRGITFSNGLRRSFTTRDTGHIKITITPPASLLSFKGALNWSWGNHAVS
jgi:hypothetical protein